MERYLTAWIYVNNLTTQHIHFVFANIIENALIVVGTFFCRFYFQLETKSISHETHSPNLFLVFFLPWLWEWPYGNNSIECYVKILMYVYNVYDIPILIYIYIDHLNQLIWMLKLELSLLNCFQNNPASNTFTKIDTICKLTKKRNTQTG